MDHRGKKLLAALRSPVGKKVLTGITGLGLTVFVLEHMLGNLSYFSSDPHAYNTYADFLMSLGPLLYAIEVGLLAFFIIHIVMGVNVQVQKKKARPVGYKKYQSVGKPSMQSLSSRTMAMTGGILLLFLILHLISFKYGPGIEEGYVVTVEGSEIRDLKRLLEEKFQNPFYAFGYPAVMLLLGFHLRHGVWSALQSLGATNPKLTPVIYTLGGLLGALIALGFLVLPLWIYFFVEV
ncbi:MAG: succinate dehydrogenase cytochrome b subunit [Rhodothermales bacterium]